MDHAAPFLILIVIICLPAYVGSVIAAKKGRSRVTWFILCGLLPLLIAVLLAMPPAETPRKQ